jgi:hypothetical protein
MNEVVVRTCEYCDVAYVRKFETSSSDRFCSTACRVAAWEGGNPNVMALEEVNGAFFLELPFPSAFDLEYC